MAFQGPKRWTRKLLVPAARALHSLGLSRIVPPHLLTTASPAASFFDPTRRAFGGAGGSALDPRMASALDPEGLAALQLDSRTSEVIEFSQIAALAAAALAANQHAAEVRQHQEAAGRDVLPPAEQQQHQRRSLGDAAAAAHNSGGSGDMPGGGSPGGWSAPGSWNALAAAAPQRAQGAAASASTGQLYALGGGQGSSGARTPDGGGGGLTGVLRGMLLPLARLPSAPSVAIQSAAAAAAAVIGEVAGSGRVTGGTTPQSGAASAFAAGAPLPSQPHVLVAVAPEQPQPQPQQEGAQGGTPPAGCAAGPHAALDVVDALAPPVAVAASVPRDAADLLGAGEQQQGMGAERQATVLSAAALGGAAGEPAAGGGGLRGRGVLAAMVAAAGPVPTPPPSTASHSASQHTQHTQRGAGSATTAGTGTGSLSTAGTVGSSLAAGAASPHPHQVRSVPVSPCCLAGRETWQKVASSGN